MCVNFKHTVKALSAWALLSSALMLPKLTLNSPGLLLLPTLPQNLMPLPLTLPRENPCKQYLQPLLPFIRRLWSWSPYQQALVVLPCGPPALSDVQTKVGSNLSLEHLKGSASWKLTPLFYCIFAPNFVISFTNMHVFCLKGQPFLRN